MPLASLIATPVQAVPSSSYTQCSNGQSSVTVIVAVPFAQLAEPGPDRGVRARVLAASAPARASGGTVALQRVACGTRASDPAEDGSHLARDQLELSPLVGQRPEVDPLAARLRVA